ncbi:hypothetical protein TNCV_605361 [Trichonephila clavipes]|nr:hypothetical protein TNCV_605361 [Trichonephila clavipes]
MDAAIHYKVRGIEERLAIVSITQFINNSQQRNKHQRLKLRNAPIAKYGSNSKGVLPQNWSGTEQNHSVTCMMLTTSVHLAPCHDEFRGPRSDYVRQEVSQIVEHVTSLSGSPISIVDVTKDRRENLQHSSGNSHWKTQEREGLVNYVGDPLDNHARFPA